MERTDEEIAAHKAKLLRAAKQQRRRAEYITLYTYAVRSSSLPRQKHAVHISPFGWATWCEPVVDEAGRAVECKHWELQGYCSHSVVAEDRFRREEKKRKRRLFRALTETIADLGLPADEAGLVGFDPDRYSDPEAARAIYQQMVALASEDARVGVLQSKLIMLETDDALKAGIASMFKRPARS